jgi:hypothetical protein
MCEPEDDADEDLSLPQRDFICVTSMLYIMKQQLLRIPGKHELPVRLLFVAWVGWQGAVG